ncbi:MAG: hypothetical protein LH478_06825 [Chitinophagaceae bacterium]|nr:hypothetical protein [Chitinophagaceae bacterium]
MQKIDKSNATLPEPYAKWLAIENKIEKANKNFRNIYDDIIMNLYKCQKGVCAYTEAFICPAELYNTINWITGKYTISNEAEFNRVDHRGELDHFDPANKKVAYWNWDNLFMIEAKINSVKTNKPVIDYLKPDIGEYTPEKYFEYDDQTHRFIPNTDINDAKIVSEIKYMIDEILCLNHGVIRIDRENYINELKDKKHRGQQFTVDRFFTSVRWVVLEEKI